MRYNRVMKLTWVKKTKIFLFYQTMTRLSQIKAVHQKIREKTCEYQECDYKSSLGTDRRKHIRAVHLKIKDFFCTSCEYKASYKNNLKVHIKARHEKKIKDISCAMCSYASDTDQRFYIKVFWTDFQTVWTKI